MSKGFRTFHAVNNTWNTTLYFPTPPTFLSAWEAQIDEAQAHFGSYSAQHRAQLLRTIVSHLNGDKELIWVQYEAESGLSDSRFEIEFQRTIFTLEHFAELIESMAWQKEDVLPNEQKTLLKKKLAIGPVLVLGSSNFPLAYSTIGGDSVAALAAGCCVVLKAHPMHVGTSSAVAACVQRAIQENGLSSFVFSHVIDDSYNWASTFAQHPKIKAIGFTGSIKGGRALMDLAAARTAPIPVFAEMGSLNPVLLNANLRPEQVQEAAQKLANSVCTDAGQFCTKPGLILVHEHHLHQFKEAFLLALAKQKSYPMLHPDIYQKFEARKREVLKIKGIEAIHSSAVINGIEGRWCMAQASVQLLVNEPSLLEEVFGPFTLISSFQKIADLQALLGQLGGQLTLSVFENDVHQLPPLLNQFIQEKVGRVILNGVPTGVSVVEAMHHGGAYPASSDARFTAVGADSLLRFTKEICWQIHQ